MTPPSDITPAPDWVQILLSVLGVLGGAGGLTAIAAVLVQRGKFRAEAADLLTDTALTLVQPMRTRMTELETEAQTNREQLRVADERIRQLQTTIADLRATLDRWYAAIFAPDATLRSIRYVARENRRRNDDR